MTVKEDLHALVDALPESEAHIVVRILEALVATADPVRSALDNAPVDDEPETANERAAVAEARAEMAAGRGIPHDEVKRGFGLA